MNYKLSKQPNDRAQALVETSIGIALLIFVWIGTYFATFMGNNHIRTAMAARHAAWTMGENSGSAPSASSIAEDFFYLGGDLVRVDQIGAVGLSNLIFGDDKEEAMTSAGNGPYRVKITYGAASLDDANAFPLTLLRSDLPFMPEQAVSTLLEMDAKCQWDETGDSWESVVSALDWIWEEIKSSISGWF